VLFRAKQGEFRAEVVNFLAKVVVFRKWGVRGASNSRQMGTKKRDLSSRLKTNPVCEWGKWGELLSPLSAFAVV